MGKCNRCKIKLKEDEKAYIFGDVVCSNCFERIKFLEKVKKDPNKSWLLSFY